MLHFPANHTSARPGGAPAIAAMAGVVETDLVALIGSLYDASIRPALWPVVLESCRQFVGGASAAIFSKDVTGQRRQLYYDDDRLDAEFTNAYFSKLAPIDPSNTVQVFAEVGEAVITSQKLDLHDFAQSRFAAEWAAPQGIIDVGFATLQRQGDWAALFGVFRHESDGPGDEPMRHRLSLLTAHVSRAVAITDMVGRAHREAETFRALVDALATAVILVDSDGRLVHANCAADALLGLRKASVGEPLHLDRHQVRQLAQRPDTDSSAAVFETDFGTRYVAHRLPLAGRTRASTGLGGDAVAAIFIQPASFDPPSIPEGLARAFDLTPAELRVALATLRHERIADIAENLGISEATVKTHLSHIFSKTDTRRQADIVKLVAGFSSPLAAR